MEKHINLHEISKILDKAYESRANGKIINLLFVGDVSIGKQTIIDEWFDNHKDIKAFKSSHDILFGELHEVNKDSGCLEKTGVKVIADDILEKLSSGSALCIPHISLYTPEDFNKNFIPLLKREEYTTIFGKKYNIDKMFGIVATAHNHNISNITELLPYFEVYFVTETKDEFLDFFKNVWNKMIANSNSEEETNENVITKDFFLKILENPNFEFNDLVTISRFKNLVLWSDVDDGKIRLDYDGFGLNNVDKEKFISYFDQFIK